jgi:peptidoglycan-associated lipoprotein
MFMFSKRKITFICLAVSIALFAEGCKKKVPAPPPPPPPPAPAVVAPPPAPTAPTVAQFSAEPSSIQRGQSATLRWEVSGDVSNVAINQGVGTVRSTGSQNVTPTSSTTYTLTATGPGGSVTSSATVSVVTPPPPAPPPTPMAAPRATVEQRLGSDVQDAFFDYDKSELNAEARDALTRDAGSLKAILSEFPTATITIEGHCDERGSAEYNLGLGDRRASSAKEFLVSLGVPADRLMTRSYGKERPQCTDANETCYQKNRRAHFSPGQ